MTIVGSDKQELRPNRRTVVRGAAWTVPVVAVAASAPAFAASGNPEPPPPVDFANAVWCKIPGKSEGGESQGYVGIVPFSGLATDVTITNLVLKGETVDIDTLCLSMVEIDGKSFLKIFIPDDDDSANATITGKITYTYGGKSYVADLSIDTTKPCKKGMGTGCD